MRSHSSLRAMTRKPTISQGSPRDSRTAVGGGILLRTFVGEKLLTALRHTRNFLVVGEPQCTSYTAMTFDRAKPLGECEYCGFIRSRLRYLYSAHISPNTRAERKERAIYLYSNEKDIVEPNIRVRFGILSVLMPLSYEPEKFWSWDPTRGRGTQSGKETPVIG